MKADQGKAPDESFWNAKASAFPRYSEGNDNYEARMLALARGMGADFRNKSVLDVGCGTGMYSIRIAKEARELYALDIAEEMLRVFKQDAASQGLSNIRFIRSGWMDYAPLPPCELVFCSMSAAVRDDASREKLLQCRGADVTFIDFVSRSPSNVMAGLYERYGIAPRSFSDALVMREWLKAKGISHAFQQVDDKWDVPWEADKLARSCALTLSRHGVDADREFLAGHALSFMKEDGKCHETTEFSAGILFWKNPGRL